MINQERVRKMTRLSVIETGGSGRQLRMAAKTPLEHDLIRLVGSLISGTLCYGCLLVLLAGANIDLMNSMTAAIGIRGVFIRILIVYFLFLAGYVFLSWKILRKRYQKTQGVKQKYIKEMDALYASFTGETDGSVTQDQRTDSDIHQSS